MPYSPPPGLPANLTGVTQPTRYVGGTTSGAPVTGSFLVGDFVIDQTGKVWICTVAGAPATWTQVSSGLPLGLTGATAATRYVGATVSGAPTSGTFAVGDYIIDQSGSAWVCTAAGTPGTWSQLGAGGSSDHKVLVDASDTTAAYLGAKLAAGSGVTLTTLNSGADEQVQIAATGSGGINPYTDATDQASDPAAPASGAHRLYSKSGGLYVEDHTGAVTGPLGTGGGSISDYVSGASGSGHIVIPGLAGSPDIVPGSPSSKNNEFAALTGWTQLGTLDTSNVTDFASWWHAKRACSSEIDGIYEAVPTIPFTVTAHCRLLVPTVNHPSIGIMLLDATPTAIFDSYFGYAGGWYNGWRTYTNRTTFSTSGDFGALLNQGAEIFMRVVVSSATSVALSISGNGMFYYAVYSGVNPGFTPAYVGLSVSDPVTASTVEMAADWIRFS